MLGAMHDNAGYDKKGRVMVMHELEQMKRTTRASGLQWCVQPNP